MKLAITLAMLMLMAVPSTSTASPAPPTRAKAPVLHEIHHWVKVTHHYQILAERKKTPYRWVAERSGLARRLRIRTYWHARAERAKTLATIPAGLKSDLLCIHSYEGSWTAYNAAGYYGGLQADWNFMRAYGRTFLRLHHGRDARFWSPTEQLHMAWKGYKARGFSPWPNTARDCGL